MKRRHFIASAIAAGAIPPLPAGAKPAAVEDTAAVTATNAFVARFEPMAVVRRLRKMMAEGHESTQSGIYSTSVSAHWWVDDFLYPDGRRQNIAGAMMTDEQIARHFRIPEEIIHAPAGSNSLSEFEYGGHHLETSYKWELYRIAGPPFVRLTYVLPHDAGTFLWELNCTGGAFTWELNCGSNTADLQFRRVGLSGPAIDHLLQHYETA